PPPKDRGGERNETAARRHLRRELMLVEREIYPAQAGKNPGETHGKVAHFRHADTDGLRSRWMLAHSAHAKAEWRSVDEPCDHKHAADAQPYKGILRERREPAARLVCVEARHPRRVGRAAKDELEEKASRAAREQVDRDPHDDLIAAKANAAHGVQHAQRKTARGAGDHADPRAAAVIRAERGAERAAEHVALEREAD